MAQFFKKKPRDMGGPPSLQFYVEFLGWLPCLGIRGNIYTNSIAYELIARKRNFPAVPKMTLQVSLIDIKFSTDDPDGHHQEKITSVKYPCIMMKDVTYTALMPEPYDDIATCIFVGFNPVTRSMLHTHVYQFDSPATASTFVNRLNKTVATSQHQAYINQVEDQLRREGYLNASVAKSPPPTRFPKSTNAETHPVEHREPEQAPYITPEMQSMQAMTNELKHKLKMRDSPLLLPPKDYDTIRRKQGRLEDISNRKSLNELVVGRTAVEAAASGSKEKSVSPEKDESQESKETPIVYPPKQAPENNVVYPTNSATSPTILREENQQRRKLRESHSSSFMSNSSGGSDRNYRSSYTPPSPSSPQLVLRQSNISAYEEHPTLRNSDRSHVAISSPDTPKRSSSHHTRENSMSSTHSGLSSQSDPPYVINETDYEIPPDYDESPMHSNHNNRVINDEHLRYSNQYGNYSYGSNEGASTENSYPLHSPTHIQSDDIYATPIKRNTSRNGGLSN